MANVRVKLDSSGVRELLKSKEVGAVCESQAARMSRASGVPYVSDVYVGWNRVNAGVRKKEEKK